MNKKLLLLTSLGLVGAALTGCGKKDEEKEEQKDVKFSTLVEKVETYADDELENYEISEYDSSDRLVKSSIYKQKTSNETEFYCKYTEEFSYTSEGFLSKMERKFYLESGELRESEHDLEEYKDYDSHGNPGKIIETSTEDGTTTVGTTTFAYEYVEGKDLIAKKTETKVESGEMDRETYTYDEKGRETKVEYDHSDDSVGPFEHEKYMTYQYLGDTDLVTEWREYDFGSGEFYDAMSQINIYDSQQRVLSAERRMNGELYETSVFDYSNGKSTEITTSYDSDGYPNSYSVDIIEFDSFGREVSNALYMYLENPYDFSNAFCYKEVTYYKNV